MANEQASPQHQDPPPQADSQFPNPSDAGAERIRALAKSLPWMRFAQSTLASFMSAYPPSSALQSEVAWICVDNARSPSTDEGNDITDTYGLTQVWNDICASRCPTVTDADKLAERFNILIGKWLVFSGRAGIDAIWHRACHTCGDTGWFCKCVSTGRFWHARYPCPHAELHGRGRCEKGT